MLEDDGCPGFIAEITPLFGKQVKGFLSELSKLLCEPLVDFEKIDAYLRRLWENSIHLGATRLTLACNKFRDVCRENDKEGCEIAMLEVRREFDELYKKFQTMLQLKQQIEALDSKQIIGVSKL
ncbi:Histidine-containing [Carex littledalei]|uniref:Histidine-containing phosphotransfer protein n=1 Tax=Carex littledalei TaxID=544730 RepID=A0A833R4M3_9POAL|nr:Histidine-containing [Carex littledalei]